MNAVDRLIETIRTTRTARHAEKKAALQDYLDALAAIDEKHMPVLRTAMEDLRDKHGFNKTRLGEAYGTKNRQTILDILRYAVTPKSSASAPATTPEKFSLDSTGNVVVNWGGRTATSDRNRLNVSGDPSLIQRLTIETAETDDLVKEFEAWVSRI